MGESASGKSSREHLFCLWIPQWDSKWRIKIQVGVPAGDLAEILLCSIHVSTASRDHNTSKLLCCESRAIQIFLPCCFNHTEIFAYLCPSWLLTSFVFFYDVIPMLTIAIIYTLDVLLVRGTSFQVILLAMSVLNDWCNERTITMNEISSVFSTLTCREFRDW